MFSFPELYSFGSLALFHRALKTQHLLSPTSQIQQLGQEPKASNYNILLTSEISVSHMQGQVSYQYATLKIESHRFFLGGKFSV